MKKITRIMRISIWSLLIVFFLILCILEAEATTITVDGDDQWEWFTNTATSGSCEHSFLFLHAPIVGHDGNSKIINHDDDFVNWVGGNKLEAVFCGDTHENNIYYDVDLGEIYKPNSYLEPEGHNTLSLSNKTFYIETSKST